jgi:bacteriophage N4 adsorption protein A
VHWLESAADLDAGNVGVQLELAYAYQRAGRPARARRALERAAELDPGDLNVQLELGYAYWRDGQTAHAQGALERVWRADPANLAAAQQLVYVHQRLGHNEAARWYARQVLDGLPLAGEAATTELADRRFGLQRLHEDLGRRVSISLDGWSGTRVGTGTSAAHVGSRYRSYSQFEAEYRLGDPPIRDGTTLAAYARILADGGDGLSALPSENPMLGLGVRWKPWRSQVIYLAAEHQHALEGHRPRDLLLRASASFLNGGRYGDDWHPSGKGWFAQNLYLDTAHYLNNRYSAFTADYRTSYHGKVAASQTVEPYGHVQINGTRYGRLERDIRSGFGLRWNIWHGATRYNAHPHRVTLGLEFQQAFKTDLADRNGLFLTLGARW